MSEQPSPTQTLLISAAGWTLIIMATLTISMFAWEYYGSNVYTSWQQTQLRDTLETQDPALQQLPEDLTTSTKYVEGEPFGIITINKIGLDAVVVAGIETETLTKGPGWWAGSGQPDTGGNTVISGHRVTYGAPFEHLDELEPGDIITITQQDTVYTYSVTASFSVQPDDVSVAEATNTNMLTLTTCHPYGKATERLIIQAVQT